MEKLRRAFRSGGQEAGVNVNPGGYVNSGFQGGSNGDTLNLPQSENRKRSFIHYTMEALPRMDNYKRGMHALKRPSIGELYGEEKDPKVNLYS